MGRELGVTEAQLRDLGSFRDSQSFSVQERVVLDLAVTMTKEPVEVSDALGVELRRYFDESQLVELAAVIAWENYRARFNRVFGVQAVGFSEGSVCVLPERRPDSQAR